MGASLPVDAIALVLRTQMTCQNLLRGATIHIETIKVNKAQSLMKEKPSRQDCGVCTGSQDGFFKVLLITLMMKMMVMMMMMIMMIRRMMMMATMIVACVRDPRIGFSKVLSSRSSHPTGHQLTGASHRISQLSKSQISQCWRQIFRIVNLLISSGLQQHFLNLDTDEYYSYRRLHSKISNLTVKNCWQRCNISEGCVHNNLSEEYFWATSQSALMAWPLHCCRGFVVGAWFEKRRRWLWVEKRTLGADSRGLS